MRRITNNISILIAIVLLSLNLSAKAGEPERHNAKNGEGYNYWLMKPVDTNNPKPIVIFLHGASLCGNNLERVKHYGPLDAIARGREIDAYVIAPQNPGGSWIPSKVKTMLEEVKKNNQVDSSRIYVIGMSLGAYGTLDYAAQYPDETAAALAMCGGATASDLSGLARMPLWIIHGTADNAVVIGKSDEVAEAVHKAQGEAESRLQYDRVSGMNHSEPARMFYLPETYDWLFSHSLNDPGRPINETPKVDNNLLKSAYNGLSRLTAKNSNGKTTAKRSKSAKAKTTKSKTKTKGKSNAKSKNAKSTTQKSTKKKK